MCSKIPVPANAPAPVDIRVGRLAYHVDPGAQTTLRYHVDTRGP